MSGHPEPTPFGEEFRDVHGEGIDQDDGTGRGERPGTGAVGEDPRTATDGPVTARRINRLLVELADNTAETECRDAAERRVCEGLVESGLYCAAWVGTRTLHGDGVAVRSGTAVDDARELAATAGEGPWTEALRTGSVHVAEVATIDSDPPATPTDEGGDETVAAIPLDRGDALGGVLVVRTRRTNAFGELERAGLNVLGITLGSAVDAIRRRELFFAEAVVELELRVTDGASLLVAVSESKDCRVSLDGYAGIRDGWRLYCDIEGCDTGTFGEMATEDPTVENCRTIVERSCGGRVELETTALPLLDHAVAMGVTVESATADDGACRVTLELPPSADAAETVARFRTAFPDLSVLSRCGADRRPTRPTTSGGILDDVTDRQKEALEAAYRAGYFEWPRTNSAEEVAPELGITSATLHWHLREAQRRLLSTLFR